MDTSHVSPRRSKERITALPVLVPFVFLLMIILSPRDGSCWAQKSGSKLPLLELRFSNSDLTRKDTLYDNHLLLCSDGLFRLMRKTQVFPEHDATINVYEGHLSKAQLAEVRSLLGSKDLEALPPFDRSSVQPFISLANSSMETADASINRGNKIQKVGYVVWHDSSPKHSIEGSPANIKDEQYKAKATLTPLIRWQSNLQGTRVDNPDSTPFGCSP